MFNDATAYIAALREASERNPDPEDRATANTFGDDTDITMTSIRESLTDRQAETRSLNEVIDLVESFENLSLSF